MTAFKVLLVDDETEFLETLVKRLTKKKIGRNRYHERQGSSSDIE